MFRMLLLLLVVGGGVLLARPYCAEEVSEPERVREALREMARGSEEGNLADVLVHVSSTYSDADGLDKSALAALLYREFVRRGRILVVLGPIQVSLDTGGQEADAVFTAALGENIEGGLLTIIPENVDALNFKVFLQKEEGEWRVTGHTRQEVFR
jgi:hypothetical protein